MIRVAAAGMTKRCKVLFCTRHFPFGFQFTKEALQHDQGVEVVACDTDELGNHIQDASVVVPFMAQLDEPLLARARQLKMVIQFGVGVETVDQDAATKHGIFVSNIPSAGMGNALSCAEHIMYLSLALLRNAPQMAESVADRRIGSPLGQTLFGKTVLVLGLGNIAKELLPRLKAFGAKTIVVRSRPQQQRDKADMQHIDEYGGSIASLPQLLPHADIVVLTCTQNDATKGIVNGSFLAHCMPGVHIVNVARGGLLDYDAVKQGLDSGRIGGLGLDVGWQEPIDPQDPIFAHERVLTTPHIAGVTEMSYRNMAGHLAAEVRRVQQGLPPSIQLNDPLGST